MIWFQNYTILIIVFIFAVIAAILIIMRRARGSAQNHEDAASASIGHETEENPAKDVEPAIDAEPAPDFHDEEKIPAYKPPDIHENIPEPPQEIVEQLKITCGYKIKVIGIGGGGCNIVTQGLRNSPGEIEYIGINTDLQALKNCAAHVKISVGRSITKGRGTGANVDLGRKAILEDRRIIENNMKGADMLFLVGCTGGGTGTAGLEIIAQMAKELGIFTVAMATLPFGWEGKSKRKSADECINQLRETVDCLFVFHNDDIVTRQDTNTGYFEAFSNGNLVICNAIRGVTDIITLPGLINVDMADVCSIIGGKKTAVAARGSAGGINRAVDAATLAINSPQLKNVDLNYLSGIIISISGPADLTLPEIQQSVDMLMSKLDIDTNIVFGCPLSSDDRGMVSVSILLAGNFTTDSHKSKTDKTSARIDS